MRNTKKSSSEEKGKGRGHRAGKRSTGKGGGRRSNPLGKDGQPLKCFVNKSDGTPCGSTTHLARDCPHKRHGKGHSKGSSTEVHQVDTTATQLSNDIHDVYGPSLGEPTYDIQATWMVYSISTDSEDDLPDFVTSSGLNSPDREDGTSPRRN